MESPSMDLFSSLDADVSPKPHVAAGIDPKEAEDILDRAIAGSARKTALKGLDGPSRARLVSAVAVVASHKRAAYQRAHSGLLQPAAGWMVEQPELAAAVALLNENFIDELPMLLGSSAQSV
jgi:hypothetical protein